EGEYDVTVINELPKGADQSSAWRAGSLAKAQINLKPGNILTASVLVNRFGSRHGGLSRFNPVETTVNGNQRADLFSLRDQVFFSNGMLFEAGIALSQFGFSTRPMGDSTYVISPDVRSGSFFESSVGRSHRLEAIANLSVPPVHWAGRHDFRVGTDID